MDYRKYLTEALKNSLYPTLKNIVEYLGDRIDKAIKEIPTEITVKNPTDIQPLLEAQNATTEAVKSIPVVSIPELDISGLEGKLEALLTSLNKKEMTVNVGKTEVNVDNKAVIDAIKKIKLEVPKMEQQEVIDYTLMLDEMMKIMEKPHYSLELLRIQEILNRISEKKIIPDELITKDGIKVVGLNRSLGRSVAYETVWQKNIAGERINPATSDKQLPDNHQVSVSNFPIDPAIEAKQLSQFMTRIAVKSDDAEITYVGQAPIGSSSASAVWKITRYDERVDEVAKFAGTGIYNQVWSNREALTYE